MPRDPHKLMDSPWIWMGHRVVTSHFTHFHCILHSSTRPRCGIRRSDLAIYISCVTESERLVGFFCILGVWFHVSLKSRTLQDPHAAGMSKMDFLFVYFSKLQGGLPRHSRKSFIYCLIKIYLYPYIRVTTQRCAGGLKTDVRSSSHSIYISYSSLTCSSKYRHGINGPTLSYCGNQQTT